MATTGQPHLYVGSLTDARGAGTVAEQAVSVVAFVYYYGYYNLMRGHEKATRSCVDLGINDGIGLCGCVRVARPDSERDHTRKARSIQHVYCAPSVLINYSMMVLIYWMASMQIKRISFEFLFFSSVRSSCLIY